MEGSPRPEETKRSVDVSVVRKTSFIGRERAGIWGSTDRQLGKTYPDAAPSLFPLLASPASYQDKGAAVSTTTMASTAGSVAFNAIKRQVNHFAENSKILIKVLDEVAQVYPVIQSVSLIASALSVMTHSSC